MEEAVALIWAERGERVNEMGYEVVERAMKALTEDEGRILSMIQSPKDLKDMVSVGRQVSGLEREDRKAEAPVLAIQIGGLRSAGMKHAPASVIEV